MLNTRVKSRVMFFIFPRHFYITSAEITPHKKKGKTMPHENPQGVRDTHPSLRTRQIAGRRTIKRIIVCRMTRIIK